MHRGYDRVPGAPEERTSRGFAKGKRRFVDWLDWIERLPFYETRGYVTRVIENAVVYEAMNPAKARFRGPNPLSQVLGKRTPG